MKKRVLESLAVSLYKLSFALSYTETAIVRHTNAGYKKAN